MLSPLGKRPTLSCRTIHSTIRSMIAEGVIRRLVPPNRAPAFASIGTSIEPSSEPRMTPSGTAGKQYHPATEEGRSRNQNRSSAHAQRGTQRRRNSTTSPKTDHFHIATKDSDGLTPLQVSIEYCLYAIYSHSLAESRTGATWADFYSFVISSISNCRPHSYHPTPPIAATSAHSSLGAPDHLQSRIPPVAFGVLRGSS